LKSTKECFQALIDGETLVGGFGTELHFNDEDELINQNEKISSHHFANYQNWHIKQEINQDWRENIPPEGVLGYAWDSDKDDKVKCICTDYDQSYDFQYNCGDEAYIHFRPMTKAEIQVYLDNAPEE